MQVTRVHVPRPPATITISDISEEDAAVLLAVCENIGGSPEGPRGATLRLEKALRHAFVEPAAVEFSDDRWTIHAQ